MLKIEKEYLEKYGDIPTDLNSRLDFILDGKDMRKSKINLIETIERIKNIRWKSISFTIFLLPKATPRPRSSNGIFYVKGASDNKKFFKKYMKKRKDIPLITTPVNFYCTSYFPIPSTMNTVEKICAELGFIRPTSKPDWDNVAKAYCDMIQGTILYDDSLVVEGHSIKKYSVKPRIEITVEYMEDYDCNFNKKKILRTERCD